MDPSVDLEWKIEGIETIPILVNGKSTIFGEVMLEYAVLYHYRITLFYNNQTISRTSSNYFHAFCEIRTVLEPQGFRFLCYGASCDCYPSGMTLDMGEGNFVYKLTMGKVARNKDMLHTFQTGEDIIPATFEEQRLFFETWLDSPTEG
jgi:hypothetical protein